MSRFVDDDLFWRLQCHLLSDEPLRSRREQGGILHPARFALKRWIDDGEVTKGIGAKPGAVAAQCAAGRCEVTLGLSEMLRLNEQSYLHRRKTGLIEQCGSFDEVRARGPGKVVHVLLHEAVRGGAVLVVGSALFRTRRSNHPARWHGEADIIDAVVRIELGSRVELMRVPASVFEHAKLREPLSDEEVVANHSRSIERARNLCGPVQANLDGLPWLDWRRQRDRHHRTVICIAVIGCDEATIVEALGSGAE